MANVRVENLIKKYGNLVALNGISFECHDGEFFTILGPSGAGKTTTLELIAGTEAITNGKIYIGDRLVNALAPQDRDVAMAFENYALYSFLSVYENIAFPLRSPRRKEKLSRPEEKERVEEIASLLGIEELLERKPQQLSGGQKQRVSLARTMIRRPQVYLLDEPIAHLDAKLRASARATLKQLADEFGSTIIYVTHNYREALALSDRILVLRRGEIQQINTPREVYDAPVNDFTARLIGEPPINLVDGEIVSENGKILFNTNNEFSFPIRKDLITEMEKVVWDEEGRRMVRIGIRPNDIMISDQKISDEAFQLPVYVIVHEAETNLITFELEDTFFLVKVDSKIQFKDNQKVWLEIRQDCLYFFQKTIPITK